MERDMSRLEIELTCIVSTNEVKADQEIEGEDAQQLTRYVDQQALGSKEISVISFSQKKAVSHFIDYQVKMVIGMSGDVMAINDILGAPSTLNECLHGIMKKQFGKHYMLESPWEITSARFDNEHRGANSERAAPRL
jgi:hypothetical protein